MGRMNEASYAEAARACRPGGDPRDLYILQVSKCRLCPACHKSLPRSTTRCSECSEQLGEYVMLPTCESCYRVVAAPGAVSCPKCEGPLEVRRE